MSAVAPGRQPRVLVVEDEGQVRSLLCELLAVWGCQADPARSGAEGLSRFQSGRYDLVLTDFAMPGMSGVELVERLRQHDRDVGIIMVTGTMADLEPDGRRLGFRLLRKPLQIDGLRAAVEQALSRPAAPPGDPQAGR